MAIELRTYDLYIKEIYDKKQDRKVEVVQLKGSVAFDPDFIKECKAQGVRTFMTVDDDSGRPDTEDVPNEG